MARSDVLSLEVYSACAERTTNAGRVLEVSYALASWAGANPAVALGMRAASTSPVAYAEATEATEAMRATGFCLAGAGEDPQEHLQVSWPE
jgi:hypothetical protein